MMSMALAKMEDELIALGLYGDEPSAIEAWADAYHNFMLDAECNAIPAMPSPMDTCKTAMGLAMTGLSVTGAVAIQAGIAAYWNAMVPLTSGIFVSSIPPMTPPPTISGISAALLPVFISNVATEANKEDAMSAIASVLFSNSLGGSCSFPGSPPLVFPIL
jgi:hypothetical protein